MAGLCLLTGSVILSLKVYLGESYTDVLIPHNQLPHAKHFSLKEQVCVHLCVCVCVHVGTHTSVCVCSCVHVCVPVSPDFSMMLFTLTSVPSGPRKVIDFWLVQLYTCWS